MAEHGSRSVIISTDAPGEFSEENVCPFFWQHAVDLRVAFDPLHEIIGRCKDRSVELFYDVPALREICEQRGQIVTSYKHRKTSTADQLALVLFVNLSGDDSIQGPIPLAFICGTANGLLLVQRMPDDTALDESIPATNTINGVAYPVIGLIRDEVPMFHAEESILQQFLFDRRRKVFYRYCDPQQQMEKKAAISALKRQKRQSRKGRLGKGPSEH